MAQLLNQGMYGCIYYPGFTCKGNVNKNKKLVTKLEMKDKSSLNEINISNKIKTIKNYSKYFSPIINFCYTKLNKLTKKNNLNDCNIITNYNNIYNDFILIYINYINGKDIDKYLLSIDIPSIYIPILVNSMHNLINNIKLLESKNIIHYDLHTGNILYDKTNNRPIIIDFGLSINVKIIFSNNKINFNKLKKATLHYSPKHYTYPPELHLITFLLNDYKEHNEEEYLKQIFTTTNLDTFIDDITNNNKPIISYEKYKSNNIQYLKEYKNIIKIFYATYVNQTYKSIIIDLLKYRYKWDYYTHNINFFIIILQIIEKNENETNKIFFNFLLDILIYNLNADPSQRLKKYKFQTLLKVIFKNNNLSYNNIKQSLDENNITFDDNFIFPDFSIFKNDKIINLIKSIEKDISFEKILTI